MLFTCLIGDFNGLVQGRHEGSHLNLRWGTPHVGTKNDWQDRIRSIRRGRKGVDEPARIDDPAMAAPVFDENLYLLNAKNDVEAKVTNIKLCQFLLLSLAF